MGACSNKISVIHQDEEIELSYTDCELSYHAFNDIKQTTVGLTDQELIKCIKYLKTRDKNLTSENRHLWNLYIKWAKDEMKNKFK